MRLFLLLLAVTWVIGPLDAQSNAERMTNDRYTRSHDFDLLHQRIEVSRLNWDSLSFDGRVTTALVALRPGLDSVVLDAGAKLQITSALRTSRHGDTLVVFLATPLGYGDTARFTLSYHG